MPLKEEKVVPFIPPLELNDYEKAKLYLVKNSCRIIKEWSEDRALYFEDPFGIVIDVVEKSSEYTRKLFQAVSNHEVALRLPCQVSRLRSCSSLESRSL
jgi:hypothetical protein